MTINSLIVYAALTLYVQIGIIFEERKLLREFEKKYIDYKSTTPMLLPGLKLSGTNKFRGSS
jgi:protein-S-isoprenylcysteine O-methyltransferase Ste14